MIRKQIEDGIQGNRMRRRKGGVIKNPKHHKEEEEEEEIEDLEELLEEPTAGSKSKTPLLYLALGKEEFIMSGKDQKHRLDE